MKTAPASLERAGRGRRLSIVLFSAGIFLFWSGLYVYMPILPVYAQKRGASLALVGLITASYGLSQLILRIPLGLASDRWGRRKPFVLAGLATVAASSLVLAWAPSPAWLLAGRALAGVAASTWVAATVLLASYFPPDQALRASSIVSSMGAAAQMAATASGGWLADVGGWLAPFYAGALIALLGAVAMAGAADRPLARKNASTRQTLQRVAGRPLLLVASAIAAVGQFVSQSTTYGFVPVYAENVLGASRTALGGLTTLTTLPYTLGALGSASIARRLGARRTLVLGLLLAAASTAAVPLARSLPARRVVRLAFGLSYGLIYPVAMGLSITGVPAEERASAMGIFQALYAIGMFAGPALSGFLADRVGLPGMFWALSLLPLGAAFGVAARLARILRAET